MEIGVHKSRLTKSIMRNPQCFEQITEYWGCDPFLAWSGMGGTQGEWDALYLHSARLAIWFPQHHIIRATSLTCASLFSDGYFDLIFIDADHSYRVVKEDITAWLPKVRKDGVLSGHDYHVPDGRHPGVAQAVNELLPEKFQLYGNSVWGHQV